ncbi:MULTISPECIES: hypothetical protein [unclassified Solwaraspora]|uniref:hypothetical protein n=1 Tax=unclassified Solwaraspora TaxID=2627926 RepID=UPI00259B7329|nr:hypothetical protein [Solwaraspora sp. WMMA2056]WJK39703.1 hypothetical protein O7608_25130 [Solwaraspora sp. WMMA2056]
MARARRASQETAGRQAESLDAQALEAVKADDIDITASGFTPLTGTLNPDCARAGVSSRPTATRPLPMIS